MPIHFMHKSVSFNELIALYAVSDVCLVSSTRDGMNLVSFEYIATQKNRHGVMVLSEFTGAAQSLNGSIIVNPWNTDELARAIHDAVTMGKDQRAINYHKLERYVMNYTRYVDVRCSTCLNTYRRVLSYAFEASLRLTKRVAHSGVSRLLGSSTKYQSRQRKRKSRLLKYPMGRRHGWCVCLSSLQCVRTLTPILARSFPLVF